MVTTAMPPIAAKSSTTGERRVQLYLGNLGMNHQSHYQRIDLKGGIECIWELQRYSVFFVFVFPENICKDLNFLEKL